MDDFLCKFLCGFVHDCTKSNTKWTILLVLLEMRLKKDRICIKFMRILSINYKEILQSVISSIFTIISLSPKICLRPNVSIPALTLPLITS